jgi:subtilisin family serine protease
VPVNPEFQGTVSNGSSKTYRLFDFAHVRPDNDTPFSTHGMGVAGICSARANNPSGVVGVGEGVTGAAPNTRLMGLIYPTTDIDKADMFIWAAGFDPGSPVVGFPAPPTHGADVITCSVGLGEGSALPASAMAALDFVTTYGRGGKGCLCFFSTGNENRNIYPIHRPWAAYERSIAVAASTLDVDGVTEVRGPTSGWGTNVQCCAPSHRGDVHNPPHSYKTLSCTLDGMGQLIGHATSQTTLTARVGPNETTLEVASIAGITLGSILLLDLPGNAAWETVEVTGIPNPLTHRIPVAPLRNEHPSGMLVSTGPRGWTFFGGTSSSTPLCAGIAALVLSANPALTWIEARQILRETALKLNPTTTEQHPGFPLGDFRWRDENGNFSNDTGLPPVWSIGYGRLDAAAAVQSALTYAFTRDLIVRDNLGDAGMVPAGGTFWHSPDLWVRNADPAVDGAAALPASYGAAGPHQAPIAGQTNWLYGRFKNIGTSASLDSYVRFYLTHWPGSEFVYPDSFVPTPRSGAALPNPLVPGTYLVGEVKRTNLAADASDVASVPGPPS